MNINNYKKGTQITLQLHDCIAILLAAIAVMGFMKYNTSNEVASGRTEAITLGVGGCISLNLPTEIPPIKPWRAEGEGFRTM
jgi:hypothetical protein